MATDSSSLEASSKLNRLDDTTFEVDLVKAFCVGQVPNGGYTASILLKAATAFLSSRNQPDVIAADLQFLNKTEQGRAVIVIEEGKIGRRTSIIHVTLYQHDLLTKAPWIAKSSRRAIVGYVTMGKFQLETGVSTATGWTLPDAPPPVDLSALAHGNDSRWRSFQMPVMQRNKTMNHCEYFVPSTPRPSLACWDFWVRFANGEPLRQAALPYIVDQAPALAMEGFRPADRATIVPPGGIGMDDVFWYPTLAMNLEMKKALPDKGCTWLQMRATVKVVKNGRHDCEVLLFDEEGELLTICNVVALVLDMQRNRQPSRRNKANI